MTESLASGEARTEEPGFPGPSQGETRALTTRCVCGGGGKRWAAVARHRQEKKRLAKLCSRPLWRQGNEGGGERRVRLRAPAQVLLGRLAHLLHSL